MIQVRHNQEAEDFISFIEQTVSLLAEEKYDDFLAAYDRSRILSREELLLALCYLDERRSAVRIDDPVKAERRNLLCIDSGQYKDGSGYWVGYDLFTDGEPNDLTLEVDFLKQDADSYLTVLQDLHTL